MVQILEQDDGQYSLKIYEDQVKDTREDSPDSTLKAAEGNHIQVICPHQARARDPSQRLCADGGQS